MARSSYAIVGSRLSHPIVVRSSCEEIESAASEITGQGARYPESSQRMIDR
jgi:hypothetical protein